MNENTANSAQGLVGYLLTSMDGNRLIFRVYHDSENFTDYDVKQNDLQIKIMDEDSYIYNDQYIDYSPSTLGKL